jgi:DNA-binding response OmpR family regulator
MPREGRSDGLHAEAESSVPIILLTAKTTEEDRIVGLDLALMIT